MQITLAASLMLFGALQAVLTAALLLDARRRRSPANRILAALMLLTAVRLVNAALAFAAPPGGPGPALAWTLPLIMAFPPLLYLHVKALTTPRFRFRPADLLHFLPVAAVAALLAPFYLSLGRGGLDDGSGLVAGPARLREALPDALWTVQNAVYLVLVFRLRRDHLRNAPNVLSAVQKVRLDWVRNLTVGFAALGALVALYLAHLFRPFPFPARPALVLNLAVAIAILAWGYLGLRQPEVFLPERSGSAGAAEPPAAPPAEAPAGDEAELRRLRAFIAARKPHLDPELTLYDLARALEIPPYRVSALLNRRLGKTFFEFVNGLRIEEAERRLRAPGADALKLLALAEDCGFRSKSAFNRVFRQVTGTTPSGYRASSAGRPPETGPDSSK